MEVFREYGGIGAEGLLEVDGRPADALSFEVQGDLDTIGNLDERNTAVDAVILAVERHDPAQTRRYRARPVRPWWSEM